MTHMKLRGGRSLSTAAPLLMGILNMTNDSFYSGSRTPDMEAAVARAVQMARDGADIIDVGAESTRPGSTGVSAAFETEALVPLVAALRAALPQMPISVDTRKASVAEATLDAGADIVNDVSGLDLPEEAAKMAALLARTGTPYVLMHTSGTPDVMQDNPTYEDLFAEMTEFFQNRIARLEEAGVHRENIVLDPGIGFGKRICDNLSILANLEFLRRFGLPILIGASRKGFIGRVLNQGAPNAPEDRLEGTLAITALCATQGVDIVRVHDVRENRRILNMLRAIEEHRI